MLLTTSEHTMEKRRMDSKMMDTKRIKKRMWGTWWQIWDCFGFVNCARFWYHCLKFWKTSSAYQAVKIRTIHVELLRSSDFRRWSCLEWRFDYCHYEPKRKCCGSKFQIIICLLVWISLTLFEIVHFFSLLLMFIFVILFLYVFFQ